MSLKQYPKNSHAQGEREKKNMNYMPSLISRKEAPFYASFLRASYTIEATVVLPIFLTMMMFGVFLFRILTVEAGVQRAINTATRTMAVVGIDESGTASGGNGTLVAETVAYSNLLLREYDVKMEYISGGYAGLNYAASTVRDNYLILNVKYSIKFPIGLLGRMNFSIEQEAKSRRWVGWDGSEDLLANDYVFVADYSQVYHRDIGCTYLNPSVSPTAYANIENARNNSGHRYYPCSRCHGDVNNGLVYVTDYGTRYHSDRSCSNIRRNIRHMLLEEAEQLYPPCSRCGRQ